MSLGIRIVLSSHSNLQRLEKPKGQGLHQTSGEIFDQAETNRQKQTKTKRENLRN